MMVRSLGRAVSATRAASLATRCAIVHPRCVTSAVNPGTRCVSVPNLCATSAAKRGTKSGTVLNLRASSADKQGTSHETVPTRTRRSATAAAKTDTWPGTVLTRPFRGRRLLGGGLRGRHPPRTTEERKEATGATNGKTGARQTVIVPEETSETTLVRIATVPGETTGAATETRIGTVMTIGTSMHEIDTETATVIAAATRDRAVDAAAGGA